MTIPALHAKIHFAGFHFLDGLATSNVTVPVFGLGSSHAWPSTLPSLPAERIMSGVAITASGSRPAFHNFLHDFVAADESAPASALRDFVAARNHQHPNGFASIEQRTSVRGPGAECFGPPKTVRVLVMRGGDKFAKPQEAGAIFVGGDEIVQKIMELDGLRRGDRHAGHDALRWKLGKVLGPRGLMPNPKTGTVTFEVAKASRK